MTLPEVLLWNALRARPSGFKFRRQHALGPFVLDFYCPVARLAIEVDGISHDMGDNPARDAARDAWMETKAIKTLRFPAADILQDVEAAARGIIAECVARSEPESRPLHHPAGGPPPRQPPGRN